MLEISRPTRIDLAFKALIISATPFARTTTRETEKFAVESIEIFETSFSEIVWICRFCDVPHPVSNIASVVIAITPNFFMGIVCQFF